MNLVASTKNFAAGTKRSVDRTKHFVVVTKYFYPYFNKLLCWYKKKNFFSVIHAHNENLAVLIRGNAKIRQIKRDNVVIKFLVNL